MPTEQLALSPQTWPFELDLLPQSAHLVGGSVRDALLGRRADYLDLDFVLPADAIQTARTIARHYGAGFVVLDAKHQIARVVFSRATVDFAQQVGPTLEVDLHRRDFTINAIAYHPHSEKLFDPIDGYRDLQQRQLRMISPANLSEDPLRLLRAYRQSAQLGFKIDPETQRGIQQRVPLIRQVAAERIRGELDCLLNLVQGTPFLKLAWRDGVLQWWLPELNDVNLRKLTDVDAAFLELRECNPEFAAELSGWCQERVPPGLHRSWLKATKLSQLLGDDLEQAEKTLKRLKYSRAEQQAVLGILRGWMLFNNMLQTSATLRRQYELFRQAGPGVVGVIALAISQAAPPELIQMLLKRFHDPSDPVAHSQSLVTGRDLIQVLQLKPGPHIGELLEAIQLAQAEGLISNREQALIWAAQRRL